MTKKDYELFEDSLHTAKLRGTFSDEDFAKVVELVSDTFNRNNTAFSRSKFEEACYNGTHIRSSIRSK